MLFKIIAKAQSVKSTVKNTLILAKFAVLSHFKPKI